MTILEDLTTQKLNTSGQQQFLSICLFCGSQNEQESISKLQSDTSHQKRVGTFTVEPSH
jgi:hypothetical protein